MIKRLDTIRSKERLSRDRKSLVAELARQRLEKELMKSKLLAKYQKIEELSKKFKSRRS